MNSTEFSQEEFWYNLHLRYGIMPLSLLSDCDGCGKNFTAENALPCPNRALLIIHHNNTEKEWGALGAWGLTPSSISYEPQVNSSMVQEGCPGVGARTGQGYDR